jgi:diguanylate cyclase (GGDEF)-like protein
VRRLAALTLAVLIAPCALAVQLALHLPVTGWPVALASTALFLLVVTRMHLAIREVVATTRRRDELQRELAHQASYDSLTGLANRATMLGLIGSALHRAQRGGSQLGNQALDLDRFKAVNDSYGHAVGDAVLREVAARLRRQLRSFELMYRIGGDEFLVVLPGARLEDAEALAQRLCEATRLCRPRGLELTLSVGIATRWGSEARLEALFADADGALYEAKADGRDRIRGARPETALSAEPAAATA